MTIERLAPDAILSLSALSGVLADITDDPDAADGNWIIATSNNASSELHISLPTPTDGLTVGAGLQEFRAQVRQFDTGQTGTPKARIELWHSGVLVRVGSDVNITGAGQVIAFTWDEAEVGTAEGVEVKIIGTKSGGSPGARNTIDIGAVEWNADTTVVTTTPVEQALAIRADVLTTVSNSLSIRSDGLKQVENTLSPRHDILDEVSASLALRFDLGTSTTPVSNSLALSSTILSAISNALAVRADILSSVSANVALRSDILNDVSAALPIRSDILQSISASLALRADMVTALSQSLALRYSLTSEVLNVLAIRSDICQEVLSTFSIKYSLGDVQEPAISRINFFRTIDNNIGNRLSGCSRLT